MGSKRNGKGIAPAKSCTGNHIATVFVIALVSPEGFYPCMTNRRECRTTPNCSLARMFLQTKLRKNARRRRFEDKCEKEHTIQIKEKLGFDIAPL